MHAMTVVPGQKGTAGVEEVPDPDAQDAALLVRGMMLGVCGTDREIAEGAYGTPPLARQPHAGKLFAIDGLDAHGLPCLSYRGRAPRSFER